ncbi:MAG: class I SAM-dependent methyltransferase [Myxococcales bacterium]|nr:class I SAM-dependent methyltransferase [Myxococcales bacterium]
MERREARSARSILASGQRRDSIARPDDSMYLPLAGRTSSGSVRCPRQCDGSSDTHEHVEDPYNRLACVGRMRHAKLYKPYADFTMARLSWFVKNMLAVSDLRWLPGSVVECGVWRGGMSAGMAEVLGPDRSYYVFDSFEGLPPVGEQDGEAAVRWQSDTESPTYYDNCSAPIDFARRAMEIARAPKHRLVNGWFEDTLPGFVPEQPIAVLRLDGDWYESTMTCLKGLVPHVCARGLVLIDHYHAWDGCSLAAHDVLSQTHSTARLSERYGATALEVR